MPRRDVKERYICWDTGEFLHWPIAEARRHPLCRIAVLVWGLMNTYFSLLFLLPFHSLPSHLCPKLPDHAGVRGFVCEGIKYGSKRNGRPPICPRSVPVRDYSGDYDRATGTQAASSLSRALQEAHNKTPSNKTHTDRAILLLCAQ